ncbi:YdcH family protein [Novispirillum itersonii]|uniref:YdcH family protein n=1 Tax=Novispirillum itersonii TaxID=189 RepID=UPI0003674448|nr:YdcH family protein [Novispirillum itersonii]
MSLDARIESLRTKHAQLDSALEMEKRRPQPDAKAIADMKRQKLRIKDEIQRITMH